MKKQTKYNIGWAMLIAGIILFGYVIIAFLATKFFWLLAAIGLFFGGRELIRK